MQVGRIERCQFGDALASSDRVSYVSGRREDLRQQPMGIRISGIVLHRSPAQRLSFLTTAAVPASNGVGEKSRRHSLWPTPGRTPVHGIIREHQHPVHR
jgi:hypothetical protein